MIKKHRFNRDINSRVNQLITLDNWHGILALLCNFLLIGTGIYLSILDTYFYPITALAIASRQGALSNLAHESAHKRLAKNKILNYFLGTYFSGYLILQEFHSYSNAHIKNHHLNFGELGKDPDFSHHVNSGLYSTSNHYLFVKYFIIMPFFLYISKYIKHIFSSRGPKYSHYKSYTIKMYVYIVFLFCFFAYFNLLYYLFFFWILPLFTLFPIIGWFIDISEHFPLMKNKTDLYMTRNRFGNFFEDFIFNSHNENYHLVHHLKPSVPFWNLKKVHRILMENLDYRMVNEDVGGIFFSYKNKTSLISKIIDKNSFDAMMKENGVN